MGLSFLDVLSHHRLIIDCTSGYISLCRLIIDFVQGMGPQEPWRGYTLVAILFIVGVIQTLFLHQYFDKVFIIGLRVRSALVCLIYQKVSFSLLYFVLEGSQGLCTPQ